MGVYAIILDWSEVWATLISVLAYFFRKKNERYLLIVHGYLIAAFLIYLSGDILRQFHWQLTGFLSSNNWLYNIHSVLRTICFVLFFKEVGLNSKWLQPKYSIPFLLANAFIIFFFLDDFFVISSKIFTVEGIVLLIYCVSFFLQRLKDDELYTDFDAPLIIVTGLTIYESVNFFVFLFFNALMTDAYAFAGQVWDVHNWAYIICCIFIAYAFLGKERLHQDLLRG